VQRKVRLNRPLSATSETSPIKEVPIGPEEAATFLRVSRATAMTMARTGRIPAHPLEGAKRKRWLFFLSELEAHVRGLAVNGSGLMRANQLRETAVEART
jgi:hypothetical protein